MLGLGSGAQRDASPQAARNRQAVRGKNTQLGRQGPDEVLITWNRGSNRDPVGRAARVARVPVSARHAERPTTALVNVRHVCDRGTTHPR